MRLRASTPFYHELHLHETEHDGNKTHEASGTGDVEAGGSTSRSRGATAGAAARRSRGGSLAGRLGDSTGADKLALDNVVGASESLEGAAVVGDIGSGLKVECTADILKAGESNAGKQN